MTGDVVLADLVTAGREGDAQCSLAHSWESRLSAMAGTVSADSRRSDVATAPPARGLQGAHGPGRLLTGLPERQLLSGVQRPNNVASPTDLQDINRACALEVRVRSSHPVPNGGGLEDDRGARHDVVEVDEQPGLSQGGQERSGTPPGDDSPADTQTVSHPRDASKRLHEQFGSSGDKVFEGPVSHRIIMACTDRFRDVARRPLESRLKMLVEFWLTWALAATNEKAPGLHRCRSGASIGAACRNRTDDLVITSDSLYRLS